MKVDSRKALNNHRAPDTLAGIVSVIAIAAVLIATPGMVEAQACTSCVQFQKSECRATSTGTGPGVCSFTGSASTTSGVTVPFEVVTCESDDNRFMVVVAGWADVSAAPTITAGTLAENLTVTYDHDGLGSDIVAGVLANGAATRNTAKSVAMWVIGTDGNTNGVHESSEDPRTGTGEVTVSLPVGANAHEMIVGVYQLCGVALGSDPDGAPTASASTNKTPDSNPFPDPSVAPGCPGGGMLVDLLMVDAGVTHSPNNPSPTDQAQTFGDSTIGEATTANLCGHSIRIARETGTSSLDDEYLLNPAADYVIAGLTVNPDTTTLAELDEVRIEVGQLRQLGSGALIRWSTSLEADTLGFNLYREAAQGRRVLVNDGLIAGSAIRYPGISLEAGYSYAWFDSQADAASTYWIEEVDLGGVRTMHGPFQVSEGATPNVVGRDMLSPTLTDVHDRMAAAASEATDIRFERSSQLTSEGVTKRAGLGLERTAPWQLGSVPAAKLIVDEDGWHRITFEELAEAGFVIGKVNTADIQLWADGYQVGMNVVGDENEVFGAGDAVEFFGVTNDTQYASGRVYWLVVGETAGVRVPLRRVEAVDAQVVDARDAVVLRQHLAYAPAADNGTADSFFGQYVAAGFAPHAIHTIPVESVSSNQATPAVVDVVVYADAVHNGSAQQILVDLNGVALGTMTLDGSGLRSDRFYVPSRALLDGDNVVTLSHTSGDGISLVDSVTLRYDRTSIAVDDHIDLQLRAQHGTSPLRIGGFSSPDVRVFDVTFPLRPTEIAADAFSSAGGWAVDVRPDIHALTPPKVGHRLVAVADSRVLTPTVEINQPTDWAGAGGADMVVITHQELMSAMAPLVQLRTSQGLNVALIDVQDLYDEYTFGVKDPSAIRDFLGHAAADWSPAPQFVLLAGDGSFDPKDYFGQHQDVVPTKLVFIPDFETASDTWYLTAGAESMVIGRLPVSTVDQADDVVGKIVSYATSGQRVDRAVLVADEAIGRDFVDLNQQFAALMPIASSFIDVPALGTADARTALLDAFAGGAPLVHFSGHGGTNKWRGNLLTANDQGALGNEDRLAFVSAMTCLNGAFQELDSLAESLIRDPAGGAIAMVSSTSVHDPSRQQAATESMLNAIAAGSDTFGEAWAQGLMHAAEDVQATTVFIGDPATRIRR